MRIRADSDPDNKQTLIVTFFLSSNLQVMSILSEATRSQQVRSGAAHQQSFFTKKGDQEKEKKVVEIKNNALILLEDVDLVFNDLGECYDEEQCTHPLRGCGHRLQRVR